MELDKNKYYQNNFQHCIRKIKDLCIENRDFRKYLTEFLNDDKLLYDDWLFLLYDVINYITVSNIISTTEVENIILSFYNKYKLFLAINDDKSEICCKYENHIIECLIRCLYEKCNEYLNRHIQLHPYKKVFKFIPNKIFGNTLNVNSEKLFIFNYSTIVDEIIKYLSLYKYLYKICDNRLQDKIIDSYKDLFVNVDWYEYDYIKDKITESIKLIKEY